MIFEDAKMLALRRALLLLVLTGLTACLSYSLMGEAKGLPHVGDAEILSADALPRTVFYGLALPAFFTAAALCAVLRLARSTEQIARGLAYVSTFAAMTAVVFGVVAVVSMGCSPGETVDVVSEPRPVDDAAFAAGNSTAQFVTVDQLQLPYGCTALDIGAWVALIAACIFVLQLVLVVVIVMPTLGESPAVYAPKAIDPDATITEEYMDKLQREAERLDAAGQPYTFEDLESSLSTDPGFCQETRYIQLVPVKFAGKGPSGPPDAYAPRALGSGTEIAPAKVAPAKVAPAKVAPDTTRVDSRAEIAAPKAAPSTRILEGIIADDELAEVTEIITRFNTERKLWTFRDVVAEMGTTGGRDTVRSPADFASGPERPAEDP